MNESVLANEMLLLSGLTTKGFEAVARSIKEQAKLNRGFVFMSLLTTIYIVTLHKKIEQLSDEVKELKQPMEE